jgi:hypothetical protein
MVEDGRRRLARTADMTLDEYRQHVLAQIKTCRSEGLGRELIQKAASDMIESNISPVDRNGFWGQLNSELEAERLKPQLLIEKQDAAALSAVIAAAQAAIAHHHQAQTAAKK